MAMYFYLKKLTLEDNDLFSHVFPIFRGAGLFIIYFAFIAIVIFLTVERLRMELLQYKLQTYIIIRLHIQLVF